jgi:AmmeMemoRadiSam system protein B
MPKAQSAIRPAFLAGQWYPDDAAECRRAIAAVDVTGVEPGPVRGLVAPHAGWAYSGTAAVRGWATLAESRPDADLVVVFGSHRSEAGPSTVFLGTAWDTPLGPVEIPRELAATLLGLCDLEEEPLEPARPDNGVELHLPLLKHFFPRAQLLMVGVAASPVAIEIGETAGSLVDGAGRKAVFVGSTDLTHYGPNYGATDHGSGDGAVRWVRDENDRGFIDRVLAKDAGGLLAHAREHDSACCPGAVAATLAALGAVGHAPAPRLVDHYLSCDVHPHASFVGYASIVL